MRSRNQSTSKPLQDLHSKVLAELTLDILQTTFMMLLVSSFSLLTHLTHLLVATTLAPAVSPSIGTV